MSVDEYIEQAPEPQRTTLSRLRVTLRELLPEAAETMTYGKPTLEVGGKAVAGYAHFKGHCSYFPHSGSVLGSIADLGQYEWSKGTLKFPVDQPLPSELVARLVDTRLGELGLDR